jgi:hypothetical protein
VKRKSVLAILTMIGCLTASATGAHAGAGGNPTPLTGFYVCQGISGQAPEQVVDITVPLLGITLGSVKIGSASLACSFARLFFPGTTNEITPNVTGTEQDLKCYALSARRGPSSPVTYNVEDVFGLDQVQANQARYLCAPASYNIAF